ncbi:hypothetical protein ADUPG1_010867, partial [Aduncisulcus paluster]
MAKSNTKDKKKNSSKGVVKDENTYSFFEYSTFESSCETPSFTPIGCESIEILPSPSIEVKSKAAKGKGKGAKTAPTTTDDTSNVLEVHQTTQEQLNSTLFRNSKSIIAKYKCDMPPSDFTVFPLVPSLAPLSSASIVGHSVSQKSKVDYTLTPSHIEHLQIYDSSDSLVKFAERENIIMSSVISCLITTINSESDHILPISKLDTHFSAASSPGPDGFIDSSSGIYNVLIRTPMKNYTVPCYCADYVIDSLFKDLVADEESQDFSFSSDDNEKQHDIKSDEEMALSSLSLPKPFITTFTNQSQRQEAYFGQLLQKALIRAHSGHSLCSLSSISFLSSLFPHEQPNHTPHTFSRVSDRIAADITHPLSAIHSKIKTISGPPIVLIKKSGQSSAVPSDKPLSLDITEHGIVSDCLYVITGVFETATGHKGYVCACPSICTELYRGGLSVWKGAFQKSFADKSFSDLQSIKEQDLEEEEEEEEEESESITIESISSIHQEMMVHERSRGKEEKGKHFRMNGHRWNPELEDALLCGESLFSLRKALQVQKLRRDKKRTKIEKEHIRKVRQASITGTADMLSLHPDGITGGEISEAEGEDRRLSFVDTDESLLENVVDQLEHYVFVLYDEVNTLFDSVVFFEPKFEQSSTICGCPCGKCELDKDKVSQDSEKKVCLSLGGMASSEGSASIARDKGKKGKGGDAKKDKGKKSDRKGVDKAGSLSEDGQTHIPSRYSARIHVDVGERTRAFCNLVVFSPLQGETKEEGKEEGKEEEE